MNAPARIQPTTAGALLVLALAGLPAIAAASGTYTLSEIDAKRLPRCVQIVEQEEAALLFANNCGEPFTVTPIAETCAGCDPEITLAPGEIGWYGLAPALPGDEARAEGARHVTWHQPGGRSGTLSAQVAFDPGALATGGCAVAPAPAGGFAGLLMLLGGALGLRRRRPVRAR